MVLPNLTFMKVFFDIFYVINHSIKNHELLAKIIYFLEKLTHSKVNNIGIIVEKKEGVEKSLSTKKTRHNTAMQRSLH